MKLIKTFIKSFAVWALILYGVMAAIWLMRALISLDFNVAQLLYWNWDQNTRAIMISIWVLLSIMAIPKQT
jgi:hypothetical protein